LIVVNAAPAVRRYQEALLETEKTGGRKMTKKSPSRTPGTIAFGALLLSSAAFAQTPPATPPTQPPASQSSDGQPQASQPPYGSPPAITLQGQQPPQQPGQPRSPAQPLPRASNVSLTFSATGPQPGQPVAVAPDVKMLTITLYMTSVNAAGEDFMRAMSGLCRGSAFLHSDENAIEASGFCNYADADGDRVFERFVVPLQSQDNPLQAEGRWMGGTGKYDSLQGGFVLAGVVLPTIDDTLIQLVGRKEGRYTLNEAQAQVPPQAQPPAAAGGPPAMSTSPQSPLNPVSPMPQRSSAPNVQQ
jgi:hypothetical protein